MGKKAKNRRIPRKVVKLARSGHHVTTYEQLKATYDSVAGVIMNVSKQGILLQDEELVGFVESEIDVGKIANELALRLKGLAIRVKQLYAGHKGKSGIVPADQEESAMHLMLAYAEVGQEIQETVLPVSVKLAELLEDANNKRIAALVKKDKEAA